MPVVKMPPKTTVITKRRKKTPVNVPLASREFLSPKHTEQAMGIKEMFMGSYALF